MTTFANFKVLVEACIAAAEERYGKMPPIAIKFDLKGRAAGMAGGRQDRFTGKVTDLTLRFNPEALKIDWDNMVRDTIPHEVAHLVAYAHPELGAKNHNPRWAAICRALGGSGKRCHTMNLTPARKTTRYFYRTDTGHELVVGPVQHKRIQNGARSYRVRTTGELIQPHHYQEGGHKLAA